MGRHGRPGWLCFVRGVDAIHHEAVGSVLLTQLGIGVDVWQGVEGTAEVGLPALWVRLLSSLRVILACRINTAIFRTVNSTAIFSTDKATLEYEKKMDQMMEYGKKICRSNTEKANLNTIDYSN